MGLVAVGAVYTCAALCFINWNELCQISFHVFFFFFLNKFFFFFEHYVFVALLFLGSLFRDRELISFMVMLVPL